MKRQCMLVLPFFSCLLVSPLMGQTSIGGGTCSSASLKGTFAVSICRAAELFLNGKSLGEKAVPDRLQPVLRWEVPNEPGEVRVIGKRDGAEAARFELATAGAADHLELVPDRSTLRADGADLSNIEIRVVDAAGRRVYGATDAISVQATGAGELAAVDSGDIRDISPVQAGRHNAYEGRILAIVRAGAAAGRIVVRASAPGLKAGEVTLTMR